MTSTSPGMGTFLFQYIESILEPDDDFRRFNMFTGGTSNPELGSVLFSSLLPFYSIYASITHVSRQHVSFVDLLDAFIGDHAVSPEAFCSKEFVALYKFCVHVGIVNKISSNSLPDSLFEVYKGLKLHTHVALIDALIHEHKKSHKVTSLFPMYGYPYYGD
jgi:hypothetical protein